MSDVFEELFIPHDSVCVPKDLYLSLKRQAEEDMALRITYRNNLQWILQFARPNDLGHSVIRAWIRELE
jgi:hypothetical protein